MKKDLKKINSILINAIDTDENNQNLTPIKYLFDRFESEYNHSYNKKRYPNDQTRLAEWLKGLPSVINLPFTNNGIMKFYKQIYNTDEFTLAQDFKLIGNYYNFIAYHLIKLNK